MHEIMTYDDVAKYLRIEGMRNSRRVIKRYVDAGKLPKVSIGRKAVRFRREDVVKFVADLIAEQNKPQ